LIRVSFVSSFGLFVFTLSLPDGWFVNFVDYREWVSFTSRLCAVTVGTLFLYSSLIPLNPTVNNFFDAPQATSAPQIAWLTLGGSWS
jgi:hypothetical protein